MRRIAATAVIGLLVLAASADAQTRTEHWNRCVNFQLPDETDEGDEKPDDALTSCSWLLQTGDLTDEEKTAAYSGRGAVFLAKKDYPAALTDLNQAIRIGLFPRVSFMAWTHYNRARAYVALDRLREALPDMDTALRVEPTASRYEARGNLRDALGDTAGALGDWDYAMLLHPSRVIPRYCQRQLERGESAMAAEKYFDAVRSFDRAMRCPATAGRALLRRGVVHRLDGAATRSLEDLDKIVAADGGPAALIERALTLQALDRRDDALKDLNAALTIDARNSRALALRASHYRALRDYDRALQDAEASLAADPRNAEALLSRGIAFLGKRQPARAATDLTAALSAGATDAMTRAYRGLAYVLLGQYDNAASDFTVAVEDGSYFGLAMYGRSVMKERQGDSAGAAIDLARTRSQSNFSPDEVAAFGFSRSLLELWPGCEAGHLTTIEDELIRHAWSCTQLIESNQLPLKELARALTLRGEAHHKLGDDARALEDLARAIATAPSLGEAYYERGWIHRQARRYDEAIADYSRAIELNTSPEQALRERGTCYLHAQRFALAIADFNAVLAKTSNDADAQLLRGVAKQHLGDWKGADADFVAATTRAPDYATRDWIYGGMSPRIPPGTRPGAANNPIDNWKRCAIYRPADAAACTAFLASGTVAADQQKAARRVRAAAYDRSQQHALAAADYTWLLERNEKDTGARFDRALAYIKAGDLRTASFDLDLLVQQVGDGGAHYFFARGIVKERTGDAAGAARDFAEALKRDPAIESYMRSRGITR